jgi:hypothetical protein
MARLAHSDRALLDLGKLENYCLNPAHPRGRHKARMFYTVLGIQPGHATWLRAAILNGLNESDAVKLGDDQFGARWRVDMMIARQDRRAVVRTVWIVRSGEAVPRFVTCWLL